MDVCDGSEVCVVCRAVDGFCCWMDVWVGANSCAECEERENIEEIVFVK